GAVRADVARRAGVPVVAGSAVGRVRVRAGARGRVTGAGYVALVERLTDDCGPTASAVGADVGRRTGVAVVAGGAVGRVRVAAGARGRVAGAGCVALVVRLSAPRCSRCAGAVRAGVGGGAGVAVGAGGAVGRVLVRAGARGRVTGAGYVTRVERL